MTALYPLVKRKGFTIIDADDKAKSWLVTYWEHILRIAFRKKQFRAKKRIRKPKQVWLSRNQILEVEHQQERK